MELCAPHHKYMKDVSYGIRCIATMTYDHKNARLTAIFDDLITGRAERGDNSAP